MKTLPIGVATLLLTGALAVASPVRAQDDSGRPLMAQLTGEAETQGGAQGASGTATIRLNQGQNQVCYDLEVTGVESPTAAHIHRGSEGQDGPPVVALSAPVGGTADGCVDADAELIKELRQSPQLFYVNVHNAAFPGGAVRGQLMKGM